MILIIQEHKYMKKQYLLPETTVFHITFREGVMSTVSNTGKSTTNLIIIDSTTEDDWEF